MDPPPLPPVPPPPELVVPVVVTAPPCPPPPELEVEVDVASDVEPDVEESSAQPEASVRQRIAAASEEGRGVSMERERTTHRVTRTDYSGVGPTQTYEMVLATT